MYVEWAGSGGKPPSPMEPSQAARSYEKEEKYCTKQKMDASRHALLKAEMT